LATGLSDMEYSHLYGSLAQSNLEFEKITESKYSIMRIHNFLYTNDTTSFVLSEMFKYKLDKKFSENIREIVLACILSKWEYLQTKYGAFIPVIEKCMRAYLDTRGDTTSDTRGDTTSDTRGINGVLHHLSKNATIFMTTHNYLDNRLFIKLSQCEPEIEDSIWYTCLFLATYFMEDNIFTPIFAEFIKSISGKDYSFFVNKCIINEKISPSFAFQKYVNADLSLVDSLLSRNRYLTCCLLIRLNSYYDDPVETTFFRAPNWKPLELCEIRDIVSHYKLSKLGLSYKYFFNVPQIEFFESEPKVSDCVTEAPTLVHYNLATTPINKMSRKFGLDATIAKEYKAPMPYLHAVSHISNVEQVFLRSKDILLLLDVQIAKLEIFKNELAYFMTATKPNEYIWDFLEGNREINTTFPNFATDIWVVYILTHSYEKNLTELNILNIPSIKNIKTVGSTPDEKYASLNVTIEHMFDTMTQFKQFVEDTIRWHYRAQLHSITWSTSPEQV